MNQIKYLLKYQERLLESEFEKNHSIKSKCSNYIIKIILPSL